MLDLFASGLDGPPPTCGRPLFRRVVLGLLISKVHGMLDLSGPQLTLYSVLHSSINYSEPVIHGIVVGADFEAERVGSEERLASW